MSNATVTRHPITIVVGEQINKQTVAIYQIHHAMCRCCSECDGCDQETEHAVPAAAQYYGMAGAPDQSSGTPQPGSTGLMTSQGPESRPLPPRDQETEHAVPAAALHPANGELQDQEDSSSDSDDSAQFDDSDATITVMDDELWMFAGDSDATVSYDSDGNEI